MLLRVCDMLEGKDTTWSETSDKSSTTFHSHWHIHALSVGYSFVFFLVWPSRPVSATGIVTPKKQSLHRTEVSSVESRRLIAFSRRLFCWANQVASTTASAFPSLVCHNVVKERTVSLSTAAALVHSVSYSLHWFLFPCFRLQLNWLPRYPSLQSPSGASLLKFC